MKYTSSTTHTGEGRCETAFASSQACISTDTAVAHGGKGEFPTPPALLAASVASCMLSMMAYHGRQHKFDTKGIRIDAAAEEVNGKLTALHCCIHLPEGICADTQKKLEEAVAHCPLAGALAPGIAKHISWHHCHKGEASSCGDKPAACERKS